MTKIGFVRHGVTHWNKESRAQGSSDIPLHEEGSSEARLLADYMEASDWDIVYSSDLLRAKQTAEILTEKLGTPLYTDTRLRERSGGLVEGTTEEERVQKWGPDWRKLDMGFETPEHVSFRGLSFTEEVVKKHPNQKILIVSHGAFIKYLLNELMPESGMDESLKNTSLTCLIKRESGWDCDLYNCTDHLATDDSLKLFL